MLHKSNWELHHTPISWLCERSFVDTATWAAIAKKTTLFDFSINIIKGKILFILWTNNSSSQENIITLHLLNIMPTKSLQQVQFCQDG